MSGLDDKLQEFYNLLTIKKKKKKNIFLIAHSMAQDFNDQDKKKFDKGEGNPLKMSFRLPENVFIVLFNKEYCRASGYRREDEMVRKHLNEEWWVSDDKKWNVEEIPTWAHITDQGRKYHFALLKKYAKLYTPGDEIYNYHFSFRFDIPDWTQWNISTGKEIDSEFTVKGLQEHAKNRTGPFSHFPSPRQARRDMMDYFEEHGERLNPKNFGPQGLDNIPLEDIVAEHGKKHSEGKNYIIFINTCDAIGTPTPNSHIDYRMGEQDGYEGLQQDKEVWNKKVDLHGSLLTEGRTRFRYAFEKYFNQDVTQFPEINREVYTNLENVGREKNFRGPYNKRKPHDDDYYDYVSGYVINDDGEAIELCESDCVYPYMDGVCGNYINGILSRCKLTHRKCRSAETGEMEKCRLLKPEEQSKSKKVGGKRRRKRKTKRKNKKKRRKRRCTKKKRRKRRR